MNAAQSLQELGQSLWLDSISRKILDDGTLARYVATNAVTGLTSNPTIFEQSIRDGRHYDLDIQEKSEMGVVGEDLFFELAIADICRAADLFSLVHKNTGGMDGWVSLEVSPLLAHQSVATVREARRLHQHAQRKNLLIKIPGTANGLIAVRDAVADGIPVNVTLLFSTEQYVEAVNAYMTGIELRIARGLDPAVHSVASIFVSRWDVAVLAQIPDDLKNKLGIAMAHSIYTAYRAMLVSPRWKKLQGAGAKHQRLLWASTSAKDPQSKDTLYIEALAAPDTISTMPETTLLALINHGQVSGSMEVDDEESCHILARFVETGFNMRSIAARLQHDGVDGFTRSWYALMVLISQKSRRLAVVANEKA